MSARMTLSVVHFDGADQDGLYGVAIYSGSDFPDNPYIITSGLSYEFACVLHKDLSTAIFNAKGLYPSVAANDSTAPSLFNFVDGRIVELTNRVNTLNIDKKNLTRDNVKYKHYYQIFGWLAMFNFFFAYLLYGFFHR
jgi:hypothetical protein